MPSILEIEHLSKKLDHESQYLFENVTATITEPTIIHVLGTSGQGKSTLLRILGNLTYADEGSIKLNGVPSQLWQPEKYRMTISYVAQQAVMLPGSVEDNLRTVSRLHQQPFPDDYAKSLMERVGLSELNWAKPAAQLSGGEKQRLALVRTLLLRPAVLLLDEVTASLDINSKHAIEQLLRELHNEQQVSLIWVTHDLQQAENISERIWFMAEHRLLEDVPTKQFFHLPQTDAARQFLHASVTSAEEV